MVNCKCLLCNFMIPMQNESYLWYSNGHSLYRRLVCKTNPPDHTFWFCCHWTNYHLQNYIKFPISEPMTHDSVQQQGTFVKRRHHDSIGNQVIPLRRWLHFVDQVIAQHLWKATTSVNINRELQTTKCGILEVLPYPPTSCDILDGFVYLTTMIATAFSASDNQKRFKTTEPLTVSITLLRNVS